MRFIQTPNLGLKKVQDGIRDWGPETRENLDKVDMLAGSILNNQRVQIALKPAAAVLTGSMFEPTLVLADGIYANWKELQYSYGHDISASWTVSAAETLNITSVDEITVHLRYTTLTPMAIEWAVAFNVVENDMAMDDGFQASRLFPVVLSSGDNKVNEVSLSFVPTPNELQQGKPFLVSITRLLDAYLTSVNLIDVAIVLSVPKANFSFSPTYNFFPGEVPDPDSVTYSYLGNGLINQIVETYSGENRTITFTYNANNDIETMTTLYLALTRVETYTYNPDGSLAGVSAVETTGP